MVVMVGKFSKKVLLHILKFELKTTINDHEGKIISDNIHGR